MAWCTAAADCKYPLQREWLKHQYTWVLRRYTPLLAYLLVPNITVHIAWGKVLFALADIAAALLTWKRVARKCTEADYAPTQVDSVASLALSAWLFNPYTATISTRGNGDSLVVLQQLLVLILLQHSMASPIGKGGSTGEPPSVEHSSILCRACALDVSIPTACCFLVTGASKCAGKRTSAVSSARSYICIATAGAVYGLLVHWRVFPVVYGPSLILFFWNTSRKV